MLTPLESARRTGDMSVLLVPKYPLGCMVDASYFRASQLHKLAALKGAAMAHRLVCELKPAMCISHGRLA
uniref:Uncharacterized protein n=1 Tax=Spironucleus salmonicida TaxID=348837 RepID=V6LVK8_9EUKA|eukprot:EST44849.1 Hypothetical protein SS50377_15295 [Spironucleus salmonicida]